MPDDVYKPGMTWRLHDLLADLLTEFQQVMEQGGHFVCSHLRAHPDQMAFGWPYNPGDLVCSDCLGPELKVRGLTNDPPPCFRCNEGPTSVATNYQLGFLVEGVAVVLPLCADCLEAERAERSPNA